MSRFKAQHKALSTDIRAVPGFEKILGCLSRNACCKKMLANKNAKQVVVFFLHPAHFLDHKDVLFGLDLCHGVSWSDFSGEVPRVPTQKSSGNKLFPELSYLVDLEFQPE